MVVGILNVVVGLLLAFGAAQEGVVGGLMAGRPMSLLVGVAGTVVSLLLSVSGVALIQGWSRRRVLALAACVLVAAFGIFASLPPHRYFGVLAILIGIGYPLLAGLYVGWGGGKGHDMQSMAAETSAR
jgi:hypothetical protein